MTARSAALLGALLARAATAHGDAKTDAVTARLRDVARGVRTVACDSVQEKRLAVFGGTVTTKGRMLLAKPDRLRWEVTTPPRSWFVLRGEEGRRWSERSGREEPFSASSEPAIRALAAQLFAWAGGEFGGDGDWRVRVEREAPAVLRLEPAGVAAGPRSVLLTFAADDRSLDAVGMDEGEGDFTRIRFPQVEINAPLPRGAFD